MVQCVVAAIARSHDTVPCSRFILQRLRIVFLLRQPVMFQCCNHGPLILLAKHFHCLELFSASLSLRQSLNNFPAEKSTHPTTCSKSQSLWFYMRFPCCLFKWLLLVTAEPTQRCPALFFDVLHSFDNMTSLCLMRSHTCALLKMFVKASQTCWRKGIFFPSGSVQISNASQICALSVFYLCSCLMLRRRVDLPQNWTRNGLILNRRGNCINSAPFFLV